MRASSASTLPDTAAGLFSLGRDEEGSEELVYYLHCWFLLHVNCLGLYIEKAMVMSQLNDTVTARAFGGLGRNITVEEVGGKNLSDWLEGLYKHFCKRSGVKLREGKAKRRRWSGCCITAQMHPARSREECAALHLCRAWVCFFPLAHTANTVPTQGKRIIYLNVALPTAREEDKEKGKIRRTVTLCRVTETEPLNQKGRSSFPICSKQVGTSGGACTNRGCTCTVPVTQHRLETCGRCHWCLHSKCMKVTLTSSKSLNVRGPET